MLHSPDNGGSVLALIGLITAALVPVLVVCRATTPIVALDAHGKWLSAAILDVEIPD